MSFFKAKENIVTKRNGTIRYTTQIFELNESFKYLRPSLLISILGRDLIHFKSWSPIKYHGVID